MLVHLLKRCNLRCRHCYIGAAPTEDETLPFELIRSRLNNLNELGIGRVYLSGGEPFLYEDLPELIRLIGDQPSIELFISTNGTLIRPNHAELLKANGATAQISIDGPPEYHDLFRGQRGSFDHAASGIRVLVDTEVPVVLVTTISRDNLAHLPWIAHWAHEVGVERISVQPLMQLGRGFEISDRRLSNDELNSLFLKLSDLSETYQSLGLGFSMSFLSKHLLLTHPCAAHVCNGARCHRKVEKEINKLVIREDGTVLPEMPALDYRFAVGKLQDGTLRELVERFFDHGYERFDLLCRTVYQDVMPNWTAALVPWHEIVSVRSKTFPLPDALDPRWEAKAIPVELNMERR